MYSHLLYFICALFETFYLSLKASSYCSFLYLCSSLTSGIFHIRRSLFISIMCPIHFCCFYSIVILPERFICSLLPSFSLWFLGIFRIRIWIFFSTRFLYLFLLTNLSKQFFHLLHTFFLVLVSSLTNNFVLFILSFLHYLFIFLYFLF